MLRSKMVLRTCSLRRFRIRVVFLVIRVQQRTVEPFPRMQVQVSRDLRYSFFVVVIAMRKEILSPASKPMISTVSVDDMPVCVGLSFQAKSVEKCVLWSFCAETSALLPPNTPRWMGSPSMSFTWGQGGVSVAEKCMSIVFAMEAVRCETSPERLQQCVLDVPDTPCKDHAESLTLVTDILD